MDSTNDSQISLINRRSCSSPSSSSSSSSSLVQSHSNKLKRAACAAHKQSHLSDRMATPTHWKRQQNEVELDKTKGASVINVISLQSSNNTTTTTTNTKRNDITVTSFVSEAKTSDDFTAFNDKVSIPNRPILNQFSKLPTGEIIKEIRETTVCSKRIELPIRIEADGGKSEEILVNLENKQPSSSAALGFWGQKSRALYIVTTLFALIQASHQLRLMEPTRSGSSTKDKQSEHGTQNNYQLNTARVTFFRPPSSFSFSPAQLAVDQKRTRRHELSKKQVKSLEEAEEVEMMLKKTNSTTTTTMKPSLSPIAPNEVSSFYAQLAELKRQFNNGGRQMALGAPCLSASDCSRSIGNSHCQLDNFTCACLPYHVEFNSTTCLPPSLLGFPCLIDSQCQRKVANSYCASNGVCACPLDKFVPFRRDKCLPASKLDDYCLTDQQCRMNDKHSYCKWKITNVYGSCKCPPNFKLINSSSWADVQGPGASNETRCAPRLGDSCFTSAECQLATKNSICGPGTNREQAEEEKEDTNKLVRSSGVRLKATRWRTSNASQQKCECAEGFGEARNRLSCLANTTTITTTTQAPEKKIFPESGTTSAAIIHLADGGSTNEREREKNRYELVINSGNDLPDSRHAHQTEQPAREPHTPTSTTSTSTTAKPTTTTSPSPVLKPNKTPMVSYSMSSLGKPCSSDLECKRRDPHSFCDSRVGVCECLRPTEACSSNSTGCHRDTFQCRSSGQCISWYFVCDQFRNCDDGSDEENCGGGGKDLSDQTSTNSTPSKCPAESFQCSSGNLCLSFGKLCNGKVDCPDGSDELNCGIVPETVNKLDNKQQAGNKSSRGACHPRTFSCQNGECLPAYVFCNAVTDCADGSDESEFLCERTIVTEGTNNNTKLISSSSSRTTTSTRTPALGLQQASFENTPTAGKESSILQLQDSPLLKTDRAAINKMLAALKRANQQNNKNRPNARQQQHNWERARHRSSRLGAQFNVAAAAAAATLDRQHTLECPKGAFSCANGKCRSSAILCSGVDGCGDNSDEQHCEVCKCSAA